MYREEEAIHIDGLSPNEVKQLRDQSEKHIFQAEVNRMMKLIINSLYRNKEVRYCFFFCIFYGNYAAASVLIVTFTFFLNIAETAALCLIQLHELSIKLVISFYIKAVI